MTPPPAKAPRTIPPRTIPPGNRLFALQLVGTLSILTGLAALIVALLTVVGTT